MCLPFLTRCGNGDGEEGGRDSGGEARPPNILFISIDSLRADHLRCYGYDRETSPNIDRLAAEGTLFENAVAESSWTLPTHITLFTGMSQGVHRVGHGRYRLADGVDTLAEMLGTEGYQNRGIWSGPLLHSFFGFDQGFEPGSYSGVIETDPWEEDEIEFADPVQVRRLANIQSESHRLVTSPDVADQGIAFLEGVGREPFFLFLHFFDVHYDYNPPEEYWRPFDVDYAGTSTYENFIGNENAHSKMDPDELKHLLALYDGEILFTDHHVGRVLDALGRLGLEDNTLVVLTSDHGDEFFENGNKGHFQNLCDEVLMIPLIVRSPAAAQTSGPQVARVAEQVRHVDVMPTVLDYAGLKIPGGVVGESLRPVIQGDRSAQDLTAVSRLLLPNQTRFVTIRTPSWKVETQELAGWPAQSRVIEAGEVIFQGASGSSEIHLGKFEEVLGEWERREGRVRNLLKSSGEEDVELPESLLRSLRELGYLR